MADQTLGVAQIEIIASLDGLDADLESAREMVAEAGSAFESVLSSAGERMIDAVVSAGQARDVWLSLGDAALSLAADIEKAIFQLTILNPLLNSLSGGAEQLPTMSLGAIGDLLGGVAGLAGFASGGEFEVGGSGGTDSALVAFRATPGERVSVTPANDRGAAGGGAVTNVNVHNYSGSQAQVSQSSNPQGGKNIEVIIGEMNARDVRANGPLGQAIRQQYGAAPVPIQR
jgi:hypothetical protein